MSLSARIWSANEIELAVNCNPSKLSGDSALGELAAYLLLLNSGLDDFQAQENNKLIRLLKNLIRFSLQDAEHVFLFGGTVSDQQGQGSISVSGSGFDAGEALSGLLGEVSESQAYNRNQSKAANNTQPFALAKNQNPPALRQLFAGYLNELGLDPAESDRCIVGKHLLTGRSVFIPEVVTKARPRNAISLPPVSEGCASHISVDQAARSAVCETIERDAVARWWYLRRPYREASAASEYWFGYYLQQSGRRRSGRTDKLLELSLDWGPPVYAVVSHDTDGRGLAMGFACAFTHQTAIRRALLESRQMEMSLELTRSKCRAGGIEVLQPAEAQILRRAEEICIVDTQLCIPGRAGRKDGVWDECSNIVQLSQNAIENNTDFYQVKLSSDYAARQVVKIFSPQMLSPKVCHWVSTRVCGIGCKRICHHGTTSIEYANVDPRFALSPL